MEKIRIRHDEKRDDTWRLEGESGRLLGVVYGATEALAEGRRLAIEHRVSLTILSTTGAVPEMVLERPWQVVGVAGEHVLHHLWADVNQRVRCIECARELADNETLEAWPTTLDAGASRVDS